MAIDNIIQDSWQGHSHGEVEDALKAKLAELVQIISGIPTGNNSVTYNMLSQQVKSILTLAQNALQSGDVPAWARQANKPEYNASEINGLEELIAGIEAGTASIADDTLTENAQKALSARQGTVIRAKINLLQQKIDALIDALANIAFTNGKTESLKVGTIDWQDPVVQEPVLTSPTNNSSVNVGEIAHDSSTAITKTITVKGENLTKALGVSVSGTGFSVSTNSISAAAANAGTTITVTFNQSTAGSYTSSLVISSDEVSATVTLTASKAASQELQTFDVEVNGANCTITGESSVSEGGTWTGNVQPNTGYHMPTGDIEDFVDVQGDCGTVTYNNGVLTITNVTSDIYISVTADINQYTITPNATNCSINASSFTVSHGGTFYGTVVPNSADYELPSTVSYGNGQTAAVSSNGSFTITNVTSDLTVTATAVPLAPSMTVKDSNNNTLASGSTFDLGTIATGGTSVSKTITVQGLHLTSALSLATSGTGFSVSPATISAQDAASGQQVTLTYTNSGAGDNTDKTGSLAISGGGLSNFTLALKAKKATATVSLANGGHCSLNSGSIGSDGTYTGILQPDPHYDLPSTISAVMGSTPITFDGTTNSYNSSTGAIKISNVTDHVVITAEAVPQVPITVAFPQDHSHMIIKHGDDVLSGDSVNVYPDDKPYELTIETAQGYIFSTAPTASGGGTITNDGSVYTLTIGTTDTNDITISAVTEEIQFSYKGIRIESKSGAGKIFRVGPGETKMMIPPVDLGEDRQESLAITTSGGYLALFDSSKQIIGYSASTNYTAPTSVRYVALLCNNNTEGLSAAYVKRASSATNDLFDGATYNANGAGYNNALEWDDFLETGMPPFKNSNGDFLNWSLSSNTSCPESNPNSIDWNTLLYDETRSVGTIFDSVNSTLPAFVISKKIAIPEGHAIEMSIGSASTTTVPTLLVYKKDGTYTYSSMKSSAAPNGIRSFAADYFETSSHFQLLMQKTAYDATDKHCYIKDTTANVYLWEDPNYVEQS